MNTVASYLEFLRMNFSCTYIRIHDQTGVWSQTDPLKDEDLPCRWWRGREALCLCLAFGTDRLRPILTDESGVRPADCNLEIPFRLCQIWALPELWGLFISNWKCRWSANFYSLSETNQQARRTLDSRTLIYMKMYNLICLISFRRDRWTVSLQRRRTDSVINNSSAFRPAAFLGSLVSVIPHFSRALVILLSLSKIIILL